MKENDYGLAKVNGFIKKVLDFLKEIPNNKGRVKRNHRKKGE